MLGAVKTAPSPPSAVSLVATVVLSVAVALALVLVSGCAATSAARGATVLPHERPRSSAVAAPQLAGRVAAAIVVDARDGHVLFGYRPDRAAAIASTTKLMTALLARERLSLDARVPAVRYHALPAESVLGLAPGERLAVRDLLAATLLASANDAAATLARAVAGSQRAFVELMNRRARELGLGRTRFANPIGLDAAGAGSTARELAALARVVLRDRFLARVVAMPQALLVSGARRRIVTNRNDLVARYRWVDGVKTGHTSRAGYVLVASAHGRLGQRVLSVVLGSRSEGERDRYSLALLRYGLALYGARTALDPRRTRRRVHIAGTSATPTVVPARRRAVVVRRGQTLAVRLRVRPGLRAPLAARSAVGRFEVLVDGRRVATEPALLATAVGSAGTFRALDERLGSGLTLALLGAMLAGALAGLRSARARRGTGRAEVDTGR